MKMFSHQYRNPHTWKRRSLYWDGAQVIIRHATAHINPIMCAMVPWLNPERCPMVYATNLTMMISLTTSTFSWLWNEKMVYHGQIYFQLFDYNAANHQQCHITAIASNHVRLCGVIVDINDVCELLILNAHMPCDTKARDGNYDVFVDVVGEGDRWIKLHNPTYACFGGDLNTNLSSPLPPPTTHFPHLPYPPTPIRSNYVSKVIYGC